MLNYLEEGEGGECVGSHWAAGGQEYQRGKMSEVDHILKKNR